MGMQPLAEPEFASRTPLERIDVLMIVPRSKSAKQNPPLVGLAIAVRVTQMNQLRRVADVTSAVAQFEAGRNKKAVGEHGGFVGAPVAVGVLENHDLVIGHLAGFELRIDGAADDPQSSARVK